jgi:hypothetical protein
MMELEWDPEVDTPATIAILGGGPVGLEVAIYARFLGYFTTIFEERRVAHRMLDWHARPLEVTAKECTTPLAHGAILAQNPDYVRPSDDHIYSGREFAEQYLVPLAKTDLLFDDIHFLSPVTDVSRLRTRIDDHLHPQERCNDEFRILVEGRHRGPWISRADIVIDCRGTGQIPSGLGPGGGNAIGELPLRESFFKHTPLDRKFESKHIRDKRVCVIGQTRRASQFVSEFVDLFSNEPHTKLFWLIRNQREQDSNYMSECLKTLKSQQPTNVVIVESLGVEQIHHEENGPYQLRLLRDDDSMMELSCDVVAAFTPRRNCEISKELRTELSDNFAENDFITNEPGYYRIRAGCLESGAGQGLAEAHRKIVKLFALIAGRDDLDLYKIL